MTEAIVEYDENLPWMGQTYKQELIRCKECRFYNSDGGAMMVCDVDDMIVEETDFCSYAERRSEVKE